MDESLLRLERQKNIGPRSAAWLASVGLHTVEDLEALGTVAAMGRLRAAGHPVTLNMAWALEATLRGVDARALPAEVKAALRSVLAQPEPAR